MGLNTVNYGTQDIAFDFGQEATGEEFNKILYNLMRPGIYEGFTLSVVDASTVGITSGTMYIVTDNLADPIGVRCETAASFNLTTITETNRNVVARFEWHEIENSYVEFLCVADGSVQANDVQLGRGTFSGGALIGFAAEYRDYVSQDADTIDLGSGVTSGTVEGGTTINLSGADDVVTALQTIVNRLKNLSGVENDSVKDRHIDWGTGTNQVDADLLPAGTSISRGGGLADVNAGTSIRSILQTVFTNIADLSGANDDAIKERLIDFGAGLNQIDADLIPNGTAITKDISGETNVNWASTKKVRAALSDLVDYISNLATRTTAIENLGSGNEGSITALQTTVNENLLPIGTILMYDGSNWTDNVTLKGWYACVAANSGQGCPDLSNLFIKGGNKGTKGTDYGTTTGNSSHQVTLGSSNLPPHTHSIAEHGHTASTGSAGGTHNHGMTHAHEFDIADDGATEDNMPERGQEDDIRGTGTTAPFTGNTADTNIDHTHTVTVDNYAASNTGNGGFANTALNVQPRAYSVIYIRKCS
jgi:hypothetical protein